MSVLDRQVGKESCAGPGAWNDPDELEVGNGPPVTGSRVHVSLWAQTNAPSKAANNVRAISAGTRAILTNTNTKVIAVSQNWGDREGYKISDSGDLGVWRKPMSSRAVATVLLNRDGDTATVSTTVSALAPGGAASYAVRDLWSHTGSTSTGTISASVPAQGAAMVLVSGGTRGVPPPSTTSTIRTTTSGRRLDVNGASRTNGTAAIIWDGNGRSNQQWRYNTDGTITAVGSGRCLDLVSSGTANGTRTQIWDCSGAASQKWTRS